MSEIEDKPLLFLDQNILGRLISSGCEEFSDSILIELEKRGFYQNGLLSLNPTPFTIFELLGLKIPKIPEDLKRVIHTTARSLKKPEEIKGLVFSHIHIFFQNSDAVSQQRIEEHFLGRFQSASHNGKSILTILHREFIANGSFRAELCKALALDRMVGFDYPSEVARNVLTSMHLDIMRGAGLRHNFSLCRMCAKSLVDMRSNSSLEKFKLDSEAESELKSLLNAIQKDVQYEFASDLVDTELTQFSVIGMYSRSRLRKTFSITCDPLYSVERRLSFFRAVSKYISEAVLKGRRELGYTPFRVVKFKPGAVLRVDENGKPEKVLRVSRIPEILSFYKMGELGDT